MKKILIILCVIVPLTGYAATYEIKEKDFLKSLEDYAQTEEFKQRVLKNRDEKHKFIAETKGPSLRQATHDREYEVPYVYTLQYDIPKFNSQGKQIGVLYPKGYTMNPLIYIRQLPPDMIIFNPCKEEELFGLAEVVKEYKEKKKDFLLVASGCELEKVLAMPFAVSVYMLDDKMVKMFQLEETISIVRVDNKKGVFHVRVKKVR